jgi:hypothetical protein
MTCGEQQSTGTGGLTPPARAGGPPNISASPPFVGQAGTAGTPFRAAFHERFAENIGELAEPRNTAQREGPAGDGAGGNWEATKSRGGVRDEQTRTAPSRPCCRPVVHQLPSAVEADEGTVAWELPTAFGDSGRSPSEVAKPDKANPRNPMIEPACVDLPGATLPQGGRHPDLGTVPR